MKHTQLLSTLAFLPLTLLASEATPASIEKSDVYQKAYKEAYARTFAEESARIRARHDAHESQLSQPSPVKEKTADSVTAATPESADCDFLRGGYMTLSPAYAQFRTTVKATMQTPTPAFINSSESRQAGGAGLLLSGGTYFSPSTTGVHQFELSIGAMKQSWKNASASLYEKFEERYDFVEVPLLARYNYNFKVTPRLYVFVGPTAGIAAIVCNRDATRTYSFGSSNSSDVNLDFATVFGAGLGAKYEFSEHIGVEIGYDYQRYSNTQYEMTGGSNATINLSKTQAHLVHVGISYNF